LSADWLQADYFGGVVLWSEGGGVAVPLESGGGVVDGGVVESAGGVLCIELSAGGAVVVVSAGALGDVDCCFEHATMAKALRHTNRRLRFMESPHCMSGTRTPRLLRSAGSKPQRMVASGVPWVPRRPAS
jgi:hypothetical protein